MSVTTFYSESLELNGFQVSIFGIPCLYGKKFRVRDSTEIVFSYFVVQNRGSFEVSGI